MAFHWFYRCAEIAGNKKLARRPKELAERKDEHDSVQVLIETRGEGGFVVCAPSHGRVHPSGRPYVALHGTLADVVPITAAERTELWRFAQTFDQMPVEATVERRAPEQDGRPGDDYNKRAEWADILTPHGWQRAYRHGEVTTWRRPGKTVGTSATTNYAGSDLLYVFSSSTEFEPERGYSKFSAYSLLSHGGAFAVAAKALGKGGTATRCRLADERVRPRAPASAAPHRPRRSSVLPSMLVSWRFAPPLATRMCGCPLVSAWRCTR